MHDDSSLLRARIERLLQQRIAPARYLDRAPVTLTKWDAPGEPVPFAQATSNTFTPIENGQQWGRPWGTTWFRVEGQVPAAWAGIAGTTAELITDIGFTPTQTGFQCEALGYTSSGEILKAVEPFNRYLRLPHTMGDFTVYLEAASNPDVINEWSFVPTQMGRWDTSGTTEQYRLTEIALGLRDHTVTALYDDLWVLTGLVDTLDPTSTRRARIYAAFADCLRVVDPNEVATTAQMGRQALAEVLTQQAAPSTHNVMAVGHAHIDSAWLWPIRETARKVARTFSNVLDLMDQDEEFVFAASSAQQYYWIKQHYPELFERIKGQVAQGKFVPVGGMWVESDTNLPGGEALARQFVYGSRFFREEFGIDQPEVWLPDSFGYSASLPQIMKLAGAKWFLTQKISWNQVNRMPHHTFWWEGIDGSQIFTHFPPVDSYGSDLSAIELKRAEDQYAEKGTGTISLVPFGYGDGGGGPTREMLATAQRKQDLEGSPKVHLGSPHTFFEKAQAEYPNPPVWSGELYLEIHRGTYTSQARTKRGNRRSESLLHQAELWAATAAVRQSTAYPYEMLEEMWRTVLLYQFHDILPGTSIGWVHDEVERKYQEVSTALEQIITGAITTLGGVGDQTVAVNASPTGIGKVPAMTGSVMATQAINNDPIVATTHPDGSISVRTPRLDVVIGTDGTLSSLVDRDNGRDAFAGDQRGNQLQFFRDNPSVWDAWDIDLIDRETQTNLVAVDAIQITSQGADHLTIEIIRSFSNSRVTQVLHFIGAEPVVDIKTIVDWHEKEKMLKLAFPFDVRAERATSEIQFGHIHRPLHTNTSWDVARFETPAHRWVHVGEVDYGFSLANDATYGHDFSRSTRADGGTTTQVRLSLLRAPQYPDPLCDQGSHEFNIALRVGAQIPDAIVDGYRLNIPVREVTAAGPIAPLFQVDNPAVIVETVKLAEDRSGDVVVRLYEAHGSRARASLSADFAFRSVQETDLHEQPLTAQTGSHGEGTVSIDLRPFQIKTLRFQR